MNSSRCSVGATWLFTTVLFTTVLLGACQVVTKEDAGTLALGPSRAPTGASGDDDWTAGRLPPSVLMGTPQRGGAVSIQMTAEPPSLNSIVDSDWWGSHVGGQVYDTLLQSDPYDHPNYRPAPGLAERWEQSPDGLTFTYYLRKGVRWHDGAPFSAKDVIATFNKVMDPTTKAVHVRAYLEEMASYEAVDDFTVRFHWKRPYFLALEAPAGIPIQPAHLIASMKGVAYNEAATNPLNRAPVGTGPFRFVRWESNREVLLVRNDDFWARPPYIDQLRFRIVKEADIGLQLAERGELDMVTRVRAEQWVRMSSPALRERFHRSRFFDANYAWIGWNQARPMFRDKRVRRALAMLVNRQGLIDYVQYGLPLATTCHFYYASDSCDPALKPLPFDPAGAVKLLEEAGWHDGDGDGWREKEGVPFRFVFMIPSSSSDAERMSTVMKEDFRRAGIDLEVQKVEWSAFTKRLTSQEFDACTLLWAGGARDEPSQIWHSKSTKGGSNFIGFRVPAADHLMEEARVTFDDAARNALYRQFGRLLYDEQPYTWLWVRPELALLSKRIHGARPSLQGWQYRDWWLSDGGRQAEVGK